MPPKKQVLTPEEKTALRRQKAIDKKLKKVEEQRQLKRDYLVREIKYGALTYKKYEKEWRQMLIKVALPRMRQELEFAWHNFERTVDCKDFTISLLMDEMRDSEEQYMHNFRAHADNIEKLMGIFSDRLNELRKDYDHEVRQMQDRCDTEFQTMKEVMNESLEYVKTMLHRLEIEKKEHNRMTKGDYFSRLDEVEVKNQLLLQKLRGTLEKRYQNIFDEIKRFAINYNKQLSDRKKWHDELKEQDDSMQALIAHQFRQMKKFYDTIRELKQSYIDMKQTDGTRLLDRQAERNYFSNSFLTLKHKLSNDMKDDFDKLARLSQSCAKTFDFLEHLNKKGEMILTLAAVCRKLETRREKILPFPLSTSGLPDATEVDRDATEKVEGVRPEMELFWQRLGQVFGVHYTLSRERQCLTQENELLVDTHNEYCERLLYPPIKPYRKRVAIPRTDGNFEMRKYQGQY